MDWTLLAFGAVLGLTVGSFLNVCADRLPMRRSAVSPRSHCEQCGTPLKWRDLVPVVSYLLLRGRCRQCQTMIPWRLPVVEAVTGLAYALVLYRASTVVEAAVYIVYASLFILVAAIDLEYQLILNRITYPWAVVSLGLATFLPQLGTVRSAVGGGVGLLVFAALYGLSRGGMGMGDVKLAAVVGLVVGLPLVLVALVVGIVTGGLAAATLLLIGRKGRRDMIPFGVFLSWGGLVTLLWGAELWQAYVSRLG